MAPIGVIVYGQFGFPGFAIATTLIPLSALAAIAAVRPIAPTSARRIPFYEVLRTVWVPGMGLAFSSVGFGVITTFIALRFSALHWGNLSLAFTAFGIAFIGARLFFGALVRQD